MSTITSSHGPTKLNSFIHAIKSFSWDGYLQKFAGKHEKIVRLFGMNKYIEGTPLGKLQQIVKAMGDDSLTAKIVRTFGGIHSFTLPKLEWKNDFHAGGTGYIDGIRPSDMTHSVMWGIDRWKRPYIAIKMEGVSSDNRKAIGVETFFQRYTNDGYIWTSGGHHSLCVRLVNSRLESEEFALFKKVVKGGEITLPYWDQNWKVTLAK